MAGLLSRSGPGRAATPISIFCDSPHCFHVIYTLFPRRLPRRLTRRWPKFPSHSGARSDSRTPPPYPASPRALKGPRRKPERQEEEMMVALMPEPVAARARTRWAASW